MSHCITCTYKLTPDVPFALDITSTYQLTLQTASTTCLHLVDAHQSITLTVLGNEQARTTVKDLSTMPFNQFCLVYKVRVGPPCAIGMCFKPALPHMMLPKPEHS